MFSLKYGSIIGVLGCLFLSGCATPQSAVSNVNKQTLHSYICIEKNKEVIVKGFMEAVQEGLDEAAIPYKIFDKTPEGCDYVMRYTATQHWDMVLYLNHAKIFIYQGNKVVANAIYDIPWGFTGGKKFKSTSSKIKPLVHQLFKNFTVSDEVRRIDAEVGSRYDKIERLKELYDKGALTLEEFKSEKRKVLVEK